MIPCKDCLTVGMCRHKVCVKCGPVYNWLLKEDISRSEKEKLLKQVCFKDENTSHFITSSMIEDTVWIMRKGNVHVPGED